MRNVHGNPIKLYPVICTTKSIDTNKFLYNLYKNNDGSI